mmetsp:Transcript_30224/g.84447  ORF Transcript_30224/g.84447 Transcript_30224/m.84447 type:complete len:209 (+) Transcript_30224:633-1259(+)
MREWRLMTGSYWAAPPTTRPSRGGGGGGGLASPGGRPRRPPQARCVFIWMTFMKSSGKSPPVSSRLIFCRMSSAAEMSCGVRNRNCTCRWSHAKDSSVFSVTVRLTASMNTSNSSEARKGDSHRRPRARVNARVEKDRSPPDRDFMSLTLLPRLAALFMRTFSESLAASSSNLQLPVWPFFAMYSLKAKLTCFFRSPRVVWYLLYRSW